MLQKIILLCHNCRSLLLSNEKCRIGTNTILLLRRNEIVNTSSTTTNSTTFILL